MTKVYLIVIISGMLGWLLGGLKDLVYPKVCLSCKKKLGENAPSNFACQQCLSEIKRNMPPFCKSCGRRLKKTSIAKSICPDCIKRNLNFDRAFSPCVYTGVIKELIHEFKYKNKDYLGFTFSKLMTDFIREYSLPVDYVDFVIPVPLHKSRMREREFNQSLVLCNHIAQEFQKGVLTDALIRVRATKSQTGLETDKRMMNVRGSFGVKGPERIKEKNILLVDDVLTTGATSSEAASALKKAGANIVFVLTLAS